MSQRLIKHNCKKVLDLSNTSILLVDLKCFSSFTRSGGKDLYEVGVNLQPLMQTMSKE